MSAHRTRAVLLARVAFGGDARTFGAVFSAMGLGAVIGGLVVAGWLKPTIRTLVYASWVFGVVVVLTGLAPTLPLALASVFGGVGTVIAGAACLLVLHRCQPRGSP